MGGRFVDQVVIEVRGGKGGDGIVSFRREARVPKGGPNGGDGGAGGDVILAVDGRLTTLADFRNGTIFRAGGGRPGGSGNRTGARGKDLVLEVPPGTTVFDSDTGEILGDLTREGQRLVVARGGVPGKGNASFATSVNRAPRKATRGGEGVSRKIRLELSLIADAGLVGVPNAGKSTLLARVTSARPKIANYPFSTLHPSLGVVRMDRGFSFVLADLPGLLEGAGRGTGLGLRFLRHVERTGILVYVLGMGLRMEPAEQYEIVRKEVLSYKDELEKLEEIPVLSRVDLATEAERRRAVKSLPGDVLELSAVTGEGIDEFLARLAAAVGNLRKAIR